MNKIWDESLGEIGKSISKANFHTWFKDTYITREDSGTVTVGVPSEFAKEWLQNKFHRIILQALRNQSTHVRGVEYSVVKKDTKPKQPQPVRSIGHRTHNELPLHNLYINRETNLNPRYDFDSFVIGAFNEIAYSAAKAIVQKPGVYNPFFIYGPTGLGKTHLIQAAGNEIKKKYPDAKIYYTSTESFTGGLVNALRNNTIQRFKDQYRKYDVLIMDDIQFIAGKEKTQEELFHLFNLLYNNEKQIIFSSDKHPNYISGLEDRLRSRFSAGMIVDVSKPDFESRIAILGSKAEQQEIFIEQDILTYIAQNVEGNIRELEGLLNSLICQMEVKGRGLSLREVKSLIKNNIRPKKSVSVEDIIQVIADFYNLDTENIYAKTRRKEIVRSRQVAMYLLREDFNVSYPLIGRKLGGRDHTTVIHSYTKIKEAMADDPELVQEIEQLRAMLTT